jgi:mono/diheme cytochrome c family protein
LLVIFVTVFVARDRVASVAWAATEGTVTNPYEGDSARVGQGQELFNQYCAHCHSPNAVSPDPPRDLRRLKARYGRRMAEVFHTTVTNGRPDKGMPTWGGQLSDEVLWTVFTFLQSVQKEP